MRYTLRLLTLDQLSRAAGLVCALELERDKRPSKQLGDVAVRDRPVGRQGRDAQPHRAEGHGRLGHGSHARFASSSRPGRASRRRSRSRTARGAATQFEPRLASRSCPTTTSRASCGSSARIELRLHRRPAAADRRGRRADLPPPAGLPDRDRRQVRRAAMGGEVAALFGRVDRTTTTASTAPAKPARRHAPRRRRFRRPT